MKPLPNSLAPGTRHLAPDSGTRRLATGSWRLYIALFVVTGLLILQNTKQATLPARQTPLLWGAVVAVMAGVLVLRSGWGRDTRWREAQNELGTIANNFYEPKREATTTSCAIAGGVVGALWWAGATWDVVVGGMRRDVVTRGLVDFEVAALAGAITGGVLGAVIGLAVGHVWETRHRRQRLRARGAHA